LAWAERRTTWRHYRIATTNRCGEFKSLTVDLTELADWLERREAKIVAME